MGGATLNQYTSNVLANSQGFSMFYKHFLYCNETFSSAGFIRWERGWKTHIIKYESKDLRIVMMRNNFLVSACETELS